MRELLREAKQFNPCGFRIRASQEVVDLFLEEKSQHLAMLGDFIGKRISLQVENTYHQEQHDRHPHVICRRQPSRSFMLVGRRRHRAGGRMAGAAVNPGQRATATALFPQSGTMSAQGVVSVRTNELLVLNFSGTIFFEYDLRHRCHRFALQC